jgi:REP element-mobilizing transposase RayT
MALAYFITFSTDGTWLHGCEKGSVDRQHHAFGTAWLDKDGERLNGEQRKMTQAPYVLDAARREVVCAAIVQLCAEKGWELLALHGRTNHVHIVAAERDPGRLMSDVKARASRELTRAGFDTPERIRWTRHGSTKHLFHQNDVDERVRYTLDEQGERMSWFAKEPRTK